MDSLLRLSSNPQGGGSSKREPAPVPAQSACLFGLYDRLQDGLAPFSPVSDPRDGGPSAGLVSSGTKRIKNPASSIIPEEFSSSGFDSYCRERRVRRSRQAISAKASAVRASSGFRPWTGAFITLTYRDVGDWRPHHVRHYTHAVRQYCRRRGVDLRGYEWVAELQARGAVHYHLVFWWSAHYGRGFQLPKPDQGGYWPHGSSNIRRLRTVGEMYLAKYVSKGDFGTFPKGLRLYGMDRNPSDSLAVHRAVLPRWVADATSGRVDRVPYLGWQDRNGGPVLPFRYRLVFDRPGGVPRWRFIPVIQRDALCVGCRVFVMAGGSSGLLSGSLGGVQ